MATPQTTHPLIRHGTHQRERLADTLLPGNLRLDDRSLADLVAFVARFARHVRFWPVPAEGPDTHANGQPLDWSRFWHQDATVLLAAVAATDVQGFRTQYRDYELAYHRAQKKLDEGKPLADGEPTPSQSLADMIQCIFGTAKQIAWLCRQIPASHKLKTEVIRIIADKLKTPLQRLVEFQKGVANRSLADDYQLFIGNDPCQQPWGMPSVDEFFCIDVRPPQDTDLDTLWRLFLTFANALAVIVAKAGKDFQYALHSRSDHPPHVALMLAFLNLFRYLQDDLNLLPDKHLFYYYHDVLRLALRSLTPDRAYVVFTIAKNIDQYRLAKGTAFLGGKDRLGLDRLYALENELVINRATLVEKKTLYFRAGNSITPLADPVANQPQRLSANTTGWSAFGPKAIYEELNQKLDRITARLRQQEKTVTPALLKLQADLTTRRDSLLARPGLIIASPELQLKQSEGRLISFTLGDENQQLPIESLRIRLSTTDSLTDALSFDSETSLFSINDGELAGNEPLPLLTILNRNAGKLTEASFQSKGNEIRIFLPASFPALKPYAGQDEPNLSSIPYPFLLIQAKQAGDSDVLRDTPVSFLSLQTASQAITDLTLQLGDTVFASNAEIPLIGTTAQNVSTNLYITTPDLSAKVFSEKSVQISLPAITGQFVKVNEAGNWENDGDPKSIFADAHQILINGQWDAETHTHKTVPYFGPEASGRPVYKSNSPLTFLRVDITIPRPADKQPINLFKIAPESVSVSYTSAGTVFPAQADQTPVQLYYAYPFGGYAPIKNAPFALAPAFKQPLTDPLAETKPAAPPSSGIGPAATAVPPLPDDAHGNLFLGFSQLVPGQTLSLLFQVAEGTGDPDALPPRVIWSYLRNDNWVGMPLAFILTDETEGLQQTGLIQFRLPIDMTNKNNVIVGGTTGEPLNKDLFWLRASATEGVDAAGKAKPNALIEALPLLIDIHAQAGSVVFENHRNSLEHLEKGIPAKTIAQLRFRDVNVREVAQPYPSFGGRLPEGDDRAAYYRRISERLRHRQRAVTVWDYERLVLEQFPKIALVKCLPHTGDDDVTRAGQVTVAVVPYPTAMPGNHRYYPSVEVGRLTAIETYLNRYNSFFVSGQGSTTTCGCHHDETTDEPCGCQHDSTLQVRNAVFEPVRLEVCVRFRPGKDPLFYRNELNKALRDFLAPWATNAAVPILFGTPISTTQLLAFLENTPYVDVVTQLRVIHYPSVKAARADEGEEVITFPDDIIPFTPRSLLTTYLNSLDEDNPNAIDHLINIIETTDDCACADCVEELKP